MSKLLRFRMTWHVCENALAQHIYDGTPYAGRDAPRQ